MCVSPAIVLSEFAADVQSVSYFSDALDTVGSVGEFPHSCVMLKDGFQYGLSLSSISFKNANKLCICCSCSSYSFDRN